MNLLNACLPGVLILRPRLVPHVLPPALAGVIFHPAAAALVAAVNVFGHTGVIVSAGQRTAPFAAVALGGADDTGPQPGLALKIHVAFQGVVHHHAGEGTHRLVQCPRHIRKLLRRGHLVQQVVHSVGGQHGPLRGNAEICLLVQCLLHGSGSVRHQQVLLFQQGAHHPVGNVPVQPAVRQGVGGQVAAEGLGQGAAHKLGVIRSGSVGVGGGLCVAQQRPEVGPDALQQLRGNVLVGHGCLLSSRSGCRSGPAGSPHRNNRGWPC